MGKIDQLLDMWNSKCKMIDCKQFSYDSLCPRKVHVENCLCPKQKRIPLVWLNFIKSQRDKVDSLGWMSISGLDKKGTMKQKKTEEYQKRKASMEEAMMCQ